MFKLFKKKETPIDWNLDYEFLKWINKNFKAYKENAGKVIDLEFRHYKYQGKEITQLEIIDRIIHITDSLLSDEDYFILRDSEENEIDELFELFHLVFWDMWW